MSQYLITKNDLVKIIGDAKRNMVQFSLPLYISDKKVEQTEVPTLAILEAALMFLNGKNLLTNAIRVDYTDACAGHDPEPPLEEESS